MAFKKRRIEGLTTSTTTTLGTVGLGASYGVVHGLIARNYASSAKAAAGSDVLTKIRLTDADGYIFFLDAADRDYATAAVSLSFVRDDTITGLTGKSVVDGTGASQVTANVVAPNPIVKSPITVAVLNGATTTDYFSIDLLVEV